MTRTCATAALAVVVLLFTVSTSYAAASCCDPANAAGGLKPAPAQATGPVPVRVPKAVPAAAPSPSRPDMAAAMGYGQPQAIPLSNLAPARSCCADPNASCAARLNASGQQLLLGPAVGCSGGCCGGKNPGAQPAQLVRQAGSMQVQAVKPAPKATLLGSGARTMLTANPVKAQARPQSSGFRTLW